MAQHGHGECFHIVGDDIIAAIERGMRARRTGEHCSSAGGCAALKLAAVARRAHEIDDIADNIIDEADRCDGGDSGFERFGVSNAGNPPFGDLGRAELRPVFRDDGQLVLKTGIAQDMFEQEAVKLRFGQRIDALLLDRVLRRDDHESRRQSVRCPVERD